MDTEDSPGAVQVGQRRPGGGRGLGVEAGAPAGRPADSAEHCPGLRGRGGPGDGAVGRERSGIYAHA
jgi:hypothetical protein